MKWTKDEDNIVRELWPTAIQEELLEVLPGRTWSAITHKAQRLGVLLRPLWTKEEEDIVRELFPAAARAELLKALPNRTWCAICAKAEHLGIIRRLYLWTKEEEDIVRELFPAAARAELLKALPSKTWSAIEQKASRLGVRRLLRPPWTKEEKDIVREMWPTAARAELPEALPSRTWSAIYRMAQCLGVRRLNFSGWIGGPLTKREEQVLIGGLLGDGHLNMGPGYANAYYEERKRNADIEYLRWKAKELARFKPEIREGRLWTGVHPELTKLWRRWYPKGHGMKEVVLEDVRKLGPLGLAVWAQDDGCLGRDLQFNFATEGFGWGDAKMLHRVLEENFGLHAGLYRDKSGYYILLTKQVEVRKLSEIIEPHMHHCMKRKIIYVATLERYRKFRQLDNQKQRERYANNPEYRAKKNKRRRERYARKKSL